MKCEMRMSRNMRQYVHVTLGMAIIFLSIIDLLSDISLCDWLFLIF